MQVFISRTLVEFNDMYALGLVKLLFLERATLFLTFCIAKQCFCRGVVWILILYKSIMRLYFFVVWDVDPLETR